MNECDSPFGHLVSRSAIHYSATVTHQVISPLLLSEIGATARKVGFGVQLELLE